MATAYNVGYHQRYTPTRTKQMDINLNPSWTTTTLVLNDTYAYCFIPAFAMVVDLGFIFPAMDTNITPTLTIDVGDSGSATRYFSAITTAQAGGSITTSTTVVPYRYTADDNLVLKIHAAAATAVQGTIYAYVCYLLDGFVTSFQFN